MKKGFILGVVLIFILLFSWQSVAVYQEKNHEMQLIRTHGAYVSTLIELKRIKEKIILGDHNHCLEVMQDNTHPFESVIYYDNTHSKLCNGSSTKGMSYTLGYKKVQIFTTHVMANITINESFFLK